MRIPASDPNSLQPVKALDSGESRRILLIEDDLDIASLMSMHLASLGTRIEHVARGDQGLARGLEEPWDLVILDLGLPGVDGLVIAAEIRHANPLLPVLIVTARSTEPERVSGLDAGADDYIVKPFSMLELVARVRAVFRRVDVQASQVRNKVTVVGDLVLDEDCHVARVNGNTIALTIREFGLLAEFVRHPGKAFTRAELLERVWGSHYQGYRHTVNTHINRLRAKIEPDPGNPRYIQTVWGVGYKFGH
ncbi:MAG: response regulator transcription factor [Granulosicoccus sp.]|nr:response regulator transcription factor [Granulosicoccus sp.]